MPYNKAPDGNKMTTKKKQNSSTAVPQTFLLTFVGEYVNIVTDILITEFTNTEEGTLEQSAPMVARGYMLDCDSQYVYVGDNPFEVSQAILRKKIVLIQRQLEKSAYDDMLNDMPDPKKKEDIN